MFNFNELVNNFLVELGPAPVPTPAATSNPEWFKNIVTVYNKLYKSKGDEVKEDDLDKLWPLITKGYITDGEIINIGIERAKILDVLKQVYNTFTSTKPKSIEDLKTADVTKITNIINKLNTYKLPDDWGIGDGNVLRAYNIAKSGADKASAVALETFNQLTIFNTVQEIVKRRTNAFDRISVLKSPTTPFKSLLQDIFNTPEQYLSGQKKITSDWNDIVDGLYVTTICNIALNTKDLFVSLVQPSTPEEVADEKELLQNVPTDQELQQGPQPKVNDTYQSKRVLYKMIPISGKPVWHKFNKNTKKFSPITRNLAKSITKRWQAKQAQPVNSSLETFTNLVESILIEVNTGPGTMQGGNQTYTPTAAPATPTTTTPATPTTTKDYTEDKTAYTNFYLNGILPNDVSNSKDENNKQYIYNIKKISELITPEAQKLIASLRNISHYEKKGAGAGERIAGAQQALQGVAAFGGAQLYT